MKHLIVWDKKKRQARALHRVKMEQKLGRRLRRTEIVHHKNENKQDNRHNNMVVMPLSDHTRKHKLKYMSCLVKSKKKLCQNPHHARGMCNTHSKQFYRTGESFEMRKQRPLNEHR